VPESVLYSEQSGWSDLLRRPDETSVVASIPSALWCLALAVPIHFLVQGLLLQLKPPVVVLILVVAGLSIGCSSGSPLPRHTRARAVAIGLWPGRPRPLALLAVWWWEHRSGRSCCAPAAGHCP